MERDSLRDSLRDSFVTKDMSYASTSWTNERQKYRTVIDTMKRQLKEVRAESKQKKREYDAKLFATEESLLAERKHCDTLKQEHDTFVKNYHRLTENMESMRHEVNNNFVLLINHFVII